MSSMQVVVLRVLIRYCARSVLGVEQFIFPAFLSTWIMMQMTVMVSRSIVDNTNGEVEVLWYHHGHKYVHGERTGEKVSVSNG